MVLQWFHRPKRQLLEERDQRRGRLGVRLRFQRFPTRRMLPQLVTPTPEQRAQGRLDRVLAEPRGPSRGGGVPLRSELLEQNKALMEENGALRRELEEAERRRQDADADGCGGQAGRCSAW